MEIIVYAAAVIFLAGWIWAIVDGFKTGGKLWGIFNLIPIQPLIGIGSAALKKISWKPVFIMILGVILSLIGQANLILKN
jgi:hypothetical protein